MTGPSKAGRELDARVAEKVMGENVVKTVWGESDQYCSYTLGKPKYYDIQGDMQLANSVPNYSEDIADAWLVVEKLYSLDTSEPTILKIYGPLSNGYAVTTVWEHHDGPIEGGTIIAETAPLAICLSALSEVDNESI